MLALRWHGNKDLRIDEIKVPELRPGWVKVRNVWAGICGSDLHEYSIGPKNMPIEPHPLTGESVPCVMGHEFSGVIDELGAGVHGLVVGQKVAVFPVLCDRTCHWCHEEAYGMCPQWGFLGYSGYGGGFAEFICVDAKDIHVIPEAMPLDVAALVEPLAVAWHAVKLANLMSEDWTLVVGAGPIGIAVVHCLVAHGVENIIVSEPSPARASQAKDAGAKIIFDPLHSDVPALCRENTGGDGAHAVFECAGVQAGFDVCLQSVRGKGKIINISIYETPLVLQTPNVINRKQISYIGSNIYTRAEFQEVIDAIANGRIRNPENMITAKIGLRNAVTDGFDALLAQKDKHVKILVTPDESLL